MFAFAGLFLGGGAIGDVLARTLAPGSFVAEAVSFFALPVAFAVSLQMWYGLALLSIVPRLLAMVAGRARVTRPSASDRRPAPMAGLPGAFVFFPVSTAAGATAGTITGLLSPFPMLFVAPLYTCIGALHGFIAWRLARAGYLMPPETV